MKKTPIDQLFNRLEAQLDIHEPSSDHKERFLSRLENKASAKLSTKNNKTVWIKPLFIAASMILIASIIFSLNIKSTTSKDLADISPEMEQTQDFFTKTIEKELFEIKENITAENRELVMDAISQLEILEAEYKLLKKDLSQSGEDKRVIYAMIDNFQNRINLLQDVMKQMEVIKQLKISNTITTL